MSTEASVRPRLSITVAGTNQEAFGPIEWGLLAAIAGIWGSSFLFIAVGLEAFEPAVVTLARVGLGVGMLALVQIGRGRVGKECS